MDQPHLRLRCSLTPFLLAAGIRWGQPVSQQMLAQATGLNPNTVTRLTRAALTDIDLRTVGLLCAYFWCQPGEILTLTDPIAEDRLLAAVRRLHRPDRVNPLPVINHIPAKLEPLALSDLVGTLPLGQTTIWRLRRGNQSRISSEALIALARWFNTTDIGAFLSVALPASP